MHRRILNLVWVLVLVSAAVVGYRLWQRTPGQLDDCTPGSVAGVSSWSDLGVSEWMGPTLGLEPVAAIRGALAATPLGYEGLLVATKEGQVFEVDPAGGEPPTLRWDEPNITTAGYESGLLDIMVDPGRGLVFTSVTRTGGDLEIRSRPLVALDAAHQVVLVVRQPHEWHNGGNLVVGPDGFVYVSLGDGGPNSDPSRNAQDLRTLPGSILRLDFTTDGYSVPPDNPPGLGGEPGPHWAYGLRNAWRISFDRVTGDLWVADVGNFCVEEVTVVPTPASAPANLGWPALEGTSRGVGAIPEGHIPPLFEYRRAEGRCAIIGGYVYRGVGIPELEGWYVFSDFCLGRLMALETDGRTVSTLVDLGVGLEGVTSFGETVDGELLVISGGSGVHRLVPTP